MAWPLISRMHSAIARSAAPRVSILHNRPVNMQALVEEFAELVDRIAPAPAPAPEAGASVGAGWCRPMHSDWPYGPAPTGPIAPTESIEPTVSIAPTRPIEPTGSIEPIGAGDTNWCRSVHVGTSAPGRPAWGRFPGPQPGYDGLIDALNLWYAEKFRLAVWCATAAALCIGPRLTREESARERCLRCAEALAGSALAASSAYMQLGAGERAQLLMEILTPALELHAFGTAIMRPEVSAQLYAIAMSTSDITCSAHSITTIVPILVAHLNLLLRFLTEELRAVVRQDMPGCA